MNKQMNETVLAYHERTKHHFDRYARGPAHINWNAQPEHFRRYAGAKCFELPLVADTLASAYVDLYQPGAIAPRPMTLNNVGALLELSLGLSAWKQYGDTRWALRCNPSSGNLHPTEGYVVLPNLTDIPAGVYHYLSHDHILEQRGIFRQKGTEILETALSTGHFLLGLTSIPWREAWKYGERAFRYCQHDIGHAIAAVRYAAATLGWTVRLLDNWADTEILITLGLDLDEDFDSTEREIPEVMLCINAQDKILPFSKGITARLSGNSIVPAIADITWIGQANVLDPHHHYEWPLIETVVEATIKPVTEETDWTAPPLPPLLPISCTSRAADLIRQRRSAQRFETVAPLSLQTFYRLLDSTLPRNGAVPWDVFPHMPRIHLVLFVHRVAGLSPGVYILLRRDGIEDNLRAALQHEHFKWIKPDKCPKYLHFYQLVRGNAQNVALQISCHQEIAADSAFSLGMLAEFEAGLKKGPWGYRQLFWEAGIVGQVLYLEAEALGVRGTGVGCYFDDAVHNMLGLTGTRYQSMYHFTIGTPLHDKRLQTLPPYAHLQKRGKR
ncbi:MAG: SagB/ThcOx family dehydrogenase [Pseudomonadota bacterium]